jgi:hypothetical protein
MAPRATGSKGSEDAKGSKGSKSSKRKKVERARAKRAGRRLVARRLRDALAERPLELPEMIAALGVDEHAVLVALRDLGKKTRGRLRSGAPGGRNCWWWEVPVEPPLDAGGAGGAGGAAPGAPPEPGASP